MSVRGTLGQRGPTGPIGPPGTDSLVVAVTNGFNLDLLDTTQILVLNPAGTLATGAIDIPGAPTDGQVIEVSTTQTVTAFTVAASTTIRGGGLLTITPLIGLSWRYIASIATWVRRY